MTSSHKKKYYRVISLLGLAIVITSTILVKTALLNHKYFKEGYLVLGIVSGKDKADNTYRINYIIKGEKQKSDLSTDTKLKIGQSVAVVYLDENKTVVFPSSLGWGGKIKMLVFLDVAFFILTVIVMIFRKMIFHEH